MRWEWCPSWQRPHHHGHQPGHWNGGERHHRDHYRQQFKAGVSVKFGSILSTTVNVTSATTLTAVSPAARNAGKVDITVSDGAATGLTSSTDQFRYLELEECFVPTSDSLPTGITAGPDGDV
ncbi:hypothetical protein ACVWZX_004957 [Deinococcus sp. UYEF24]